MEPKIIISLKEYNEIKSENELFRKFESQNANNAWIRVFQHEYCGGDYWKIISNDELSSKLFKEIELLKKENSDLEVKIFILEGRSFFDYLFGRYK